MIIGVIIVVVVTAIILLGLVTITNTTAHNNTELGTISIPNKIVGITPTVITHKRIIPGSIVHTPEQFRVQANASIAKSYEDHNLCMGMCDTSGNCLNTTGDHDILGVCAYDSDCNGCKSFGKLIADSRK